MSPPDTRRHIRSGRRPVRRGSVWRQPDGQRRACALAPTMSGSLMRGPLGRPAWSRSPRAVRACSTTGSTTPGRPSTSMPASAAGQSGVGRGDAGAAVRGDGRARRRARRGEGRAKLGRRRGSGPRRRRWPSAGSRRPGCDRLRGRGARRRRGTARGRARRAGARAGARPRRRRSSATSSISVSSIVPRTGCTSPVSSGSPSSSHARRPPSSTRTSATPLRASSHHARPRRPSCTSS